MRVQRRSGLLTNHCLRCLKLVCLTTCVVVSAALLLLSSTLEYLDYCHTECTGHLLESPLFMRDPLLGEHLRRDVIYPYQAEAPHPLTQDEVTNPSWKTFGQWGNLQLFLKSVFDKSFNCTFVDVGAGDGVHLSSTSWLETTRSWKGLLVDVLDTNIQHIRRRRKAMAAHACVTRLPFPTREQLWLPYVDSRLNKLQQIMGRYGTRLLQFTAEEDRRDGYVQETQCYSLKSLLYAAFGRFPAIHLMVLDTGGDNIAILNSLSGITIYARCLFFVAGVLCVRLIAQVVCIQKGALIITNLNYNYTK